MENAATMPTQLLKRKADIIKTNNILIFLIVTTYYLLFLLIKSKDNKTIKQMEKSKYQ